MVQPFAWLLLLQKSAPPTIFIYGAKSPLTKAFVLLAPFSWPDKHKIIIQSPDKKSLVFRSIHLFDHLIKRETQNQKVPMEKPNYDWHS